MIFNQDNFLSIGSTHEICQDYSLIDDKFIVISDGCSGSNLSDYGSRILTKSSLNNQNIFEDKEDFVKKTINSSKEIINHLDLQEDCLCATLLACKANEDFFDALICGDGTIVCEDKSNNLHVYEYSYESGAPFYPLYFENKDLIKLYLEKFGSYHTLNYYKYNLINFDLIEFTTSKIPINENLNTHKFPTSEFISVALFSDGLNSFQVKSNKTIYSSKKVLQDLYDFKGYTGRFLLRRCRKQFSIFEQNGISHYDDFSMAMIRTLN